MKIGFIIGSLRQGSFNRMVANAMLQMLPEGMEAKIIEIKDLPFYNEDLDQNPPQAWVDFRQEVAQADGFIFFTPEYNRTFPAAIKNALDVASRPYGSNQWNAKPSGIVSVSPGGMGGMAANHALRQPMVFLNIPLLQQPEAYFSSIHTRLTDGEFDTGMKEHFKEYLDAYKNFAEKLI